jgi:hypothetical protein
MQRVLRSAFLSTQTAHACRSVNYFPRRSLIALLKPRSAEETSAVFDLVYEAEGPIE